MKEELKDEVISFRVSSEALERISEKAQLRGEGVNEFRRNLILSESAKPFALTASEHVLFEQIAIIRHLLGRLLRESLPAEEFARVKREVAEHAGGIARGVLAKGHAARGPARPSPPSEARVEGGGDGRSEPVH